MAINKRVKSFSPYSYNAQYRKLGSNLNTKPITYVNSAPIQEEYYVVSRKNPNFNVFVNSVFTYSYDNECNYKFIRGESKFKIEKITNKLKSSYNVIEYSYDHDHDLILLENNCGFIWIDENTILSEGTYDYYFDYVALDGNDYVNDIEFSLTDDKKIKMKFEHHYDDLNIYLYKINESFNVFEENVQMNMIENQPFIVNKFGSLDVIPVVFDLNNKRYNLQYDISPSYISFLSNSIETAADIEKTKNEIIIELNRILNENINIPTSVLYEENDEFSFNLDKFKELEKNLEQIKNVNVGKSFLYNHDDMIQYYAKYGQNDFEMSWNNNILTIAHNLNGVVKVTVDYVTENNVNETINKMTYKVKRKSNNEIEIDFMKNKMSEYCITLFKI